MMEVRQLDIPDLVVLQPKAFADDRGQFFESYNAAQFEAAVGKEVVFVQDNQSVSRSGVVRGLHYQAPPYAQGKLVRVVSGSAFDVAVDIRRNSPTFGKWTGIELSATNRLQLWIPPGFAHGFLALEDDTTFLYKVTTFREAASERSIRWNDPAIGIDWPLDGLVPVLSAKDSAAPLLAEAELFE